MESVEDQWQLLRRDGLAVVAHGYIGLAAALPDGQTQVAALGAELHRVVQQIVNDLGDIVLIGHGVYRVLREVHVHIQVLVVDLLLEGDEHLSCTLGQIEVELLFLGDALLLLQLGDIQHTAHQSAQAFGFVRHNLQIMPPPFLGDGAVQYAVHIAGNGGHGGFQLVGHVGHEFLPGVFTLLQGRGHVVEG